MGTIWTCYLSRTNGLFCIWQREKKNPNNTCLPYESLKFVGVQLRDVLDEQSSNETMMCTTIWVASHGVLGHTYVSKSQHGGKIPTFEHQ